MASTSFGNLEQNASGSSTVISEAHWHLRTTRILLVIKIYLCRLLRTLLSSGICSLMKYFNNWYLIILELFGLTFPWNSIICSHLTSGFYTLNASYYVVEHSAIWVWRNTPSCIVEFNHHYLKLDEKPFVGGKVEYKI